MSKTKPEEVKYWAPDDVYNKARFQLNSSMWALLNSVYNTCGFNADFNVGVANELVKLAEDFSLRVRGVDKPIKSEYNNRFGGD